MALISVTSQETGLLFDLEATQISNVIAYNGGSAIFFDNYGGNPERYNVTETPAQVATSSGDLLFSIVNVPTPLDITATITYDNLVGTFIGGEQIQIGQPMSGVISSDSGTVLVVSNFQGGVVADNLVIRGLQSGATALVNGSGTTYAYGNSSTIYINSAKIDTVQDYNIASLNLIQYKALINSPATQFYTSTTIAAIEAASAAFSPVFIGGTQTVTGAKTLSATTTFSGLILETGVQAISGAGAIDITNKRTDITTTGANAYTLANGAVGQIKKIVMVVDGGAATITPTTLLGHTTITLNAVGDSVVLQYGTGGWAAIGGHSYALA
jgi:hypothetical protein